MARYIYKPKPKVSDKRKERQKLYQMKEWRNLSKLFLMQNPLCAKCLEEGRTTPSEHTHHKISPFQEGLAPEQKLALLLDWNNLMALCAKCHNEIHQTQQKDKKNEKKE